MAGVDARLVDILGVAVHEAEASPLAASERHLDGERVAAELSLAELHGVEGWTALDLRQDLDLELLENVGLSDLGDGGDERVEPRAVDGDADVGRVSGRLARVRGTGAPPWRGDARRRRRGRHD